MYKIDGTMATGLRSALNPSVVKTGIGYECSCKIIKTVIRVPLSLLGTPPSLLGTLCAWVDVVWSSFLGLLIMKKSRKPTQKVHRPITWVSFLVVTEATYWGKWVMTDSMHTLQMSCDDWNSVRQVMWQEPESTNKHQSLFLSFNKSLKPCLKVGFSTFRWF